MHSKKVDSFAESCNIHCMNRALRILHFRARQIFFRSSSGACYSQGIWSRALFHSTKIAEISKRVQMVGKFFGINGTFLMRPIQPKIRAILGGKSNGTEISGQKFSIILACVAGGIVGVREIKFWRRRRQKRAAKLREIPIPFPIVLAASARSSALPPKL